MFGKRVVVDSNVYISALVFGGTPRKILELAETGDYILITSDGIKIEVETVLSSKFGWSKARVAHACQKMWKVAEFVRPEYKLKIIKRDPSDNKILECAATSDAHSIITGDDDLLELNHFRNTEILNPRNFFEYLKLHGLQSSQN